MKGSRPLYIALIHSPVRNRKGETVTSSVTNLDIHDLSRSARTYGALKYFVVTPLLDQKELVERIISHWTSVKAKAAHPDRAEALGLLQVVESFEQVKEFIVSKHGKRPEIVYTDGRVEPGSISYAQYRKELEESPENTPICVVFGTAWGLSPEFMKEADRILHPVFGPLGEKGYNHLSVRAASAVILDRLFGL